MFKLVIPQNKLINEISDWDANKKETFLSSETKLKLTEFQNDFASKLISSVKKSEFKRFLIDGVTGSGKTEIYFEAVNQVI